MGALLLLALASGLVGYTLVYHGLKTLAGQNISFGQLVLGQ